MNNPGVQEGAPGRGEDGAGRDYHGIRLTSSFWDAQRAIAVLERYYRGPFDSKQAYTGGSWDTFDPSGTRAAAAKRFTADDLVACALLSTPIPARAAIMLLDTQREHFAELLTAVGPDRPFVDLNADDPAELGFAAVRDLYRALLDLPGIGATRATKLLARKRPHLVPIVDSVITKAIFTGSRQQWAPLHAAMTADGCRLWEWLEQVHRAAALPSAVPVLRIFDVLAWMDGTGNSQAALAHQ